MCNYIYAYTCSGKELVDIFVSPTNKKGNEEEEESDFKEPAELDGKLRWQVIRLVPAKSRAPSAAGRLKDTSPPPDRGAAEDPEKETAAVSDSDRLGECDEELEELVRKEVDVSLRNVT